jgi:putative ABC transport system permease protein
VAIVWGELFFLLLLGIFLGLAIGYAAARAITSWLTATTAVRMPVEFARAMSGLLLALLLLQRWFHWFRR